MVKHIKNLTAVQPCRNPSGVRGSICMINQDVVEHEEHDEQTCTNR